MELFDENERNMVVRSLKVFDNYQLNMIKETYRQKCKTRENQEPDDEFMNLIDTELNLRTEDDNESSIIKCIKRIESIFVEAHKRINSNKLEIN